MHTEGHILVKKNNNNKQTKKPKKEKKTVAEAKVTMFDTMFLKFLGLNRITPNVSDFGKRN